MIRELMQKRGEAVDAARKIVDGAEAAGRDLTADEQVEYDRHVATATSLRKRIERAQQLDGMAGSGGRGARQAPAVNKIGLGDNFATALHHWIKTGDSGGLEPEQVGEARINGLRSERYELRASNATDMNIGTAADGGNLVPTDFYNQIVSRRDDLMLSAKLPVMRVPGVGTTVDIPYDNEADGEFVATSEAGTYDLDAPAVGKKSLTLVLYSKYTDVSYQLLEDTSTNLMDWLSDFVGRGMAKTHNTLLLAEVAANGTSLTSFAATGAIAFGEPEAIIGNDNLANYLDDDAAVAWVTRSATLWALKTLTGNTRYYATPNSDAVKELLGYPVHYSQAAAAMGASAKSVYFGNWRYVAMREGPGLTFIRDPYTVAVKGQVRLLWHFRAAYGVTQAEAIGYGVHAAS